MVILLTGATGFIGRHIYNLLLGGDDDVYPTCGRLVDLFNPANGRMLLDKVKPDCLIANAWMAVPKVFWDHRSNPQWADATEQLIAYFYRIGGKRCVFVSSEAAEKHLDTPYGRCKRRVETYIKQYPNAFSFRIGYPRGEREAFAFAQQIAAIATTPTIIDTEVFMRDGHYDLIGPEYDT